MKKVLSLVLAFAMILGSFGFVFASDFPDVEDTAYYGEPVNVLSGLGVIGGFPDGTFGPEKEVTRAQMATMIVNCLGMTVTGQTDTKFSDVPASHWASGFINYAASVGFIAGYPDGSFKPDQQVTYDQALTMIVAAEGYKSDSLTGSWPGNFVNQARALGILDICETTGTANAPRQDIACFLYKALTNKLGYTDKDGAFHANLDGSGVANDTMLSRLGAEVLKNADGTDKFFVIEGTEDSVINLKNYMGAYASVYVNKDGDIVAMKEVKSQFIEGYLDDLKDEYKFDSAKQAAADIYKSFKNGDIDGTDVAYDKPEDSVKLAVKLSSTGKSVSEIYSMQVWTAATTIMADEDIQDYITGKTPKIEGIKFALDEDDEIDTNSFVLNGVSAVSEIKEDDVVTIYKGSDGTIARLDVSDKTVNGTITKVGKDGDTFTIGGEVYDWNKDAKTTKDELKQLMKDETEATFYLDYAGDIFFADEEATTTNYAVVLDTGATGGDWESDTGTKMVKLFLADGTTKQFEATGDFAKTFTGKVSSACAAGDLVKYSVDKKEKVTEVVKVTAKGTIEFDKNGVGSGIALKDSTVVFNFAGDETDPAELAKAANYSIVKVADLYEKKVDSAFHAEEGGNYKALLAINYVAADEVYTFFVKDNGSTKDGKLVTALYDGEVKDFNVTYTGTIPFFTTGAAIDSYKLTFDGEDVSDIQPGITSVEHFDGMKKGTFSGGVYKYNDVNYSMDPDVVVYVKDGSNWSVEKASYLSKAAEFFSDIYLFKSDKLYDIVVVVVK